MAATNIGNNVILYTMEDSEGKIWACTLNGLYRLEDFENKKFVRYNTENPKTKGGNNDVYEMCFEDSKGMIWGCSLYGLVCIDKDKKIKTYLMKDGLPNSYMNAITEDKNGNLWISTNGGLSQFDRTNQTFRNYNHLDGLQGNLFNRNAVWNIRDRDLIVFGGTNGLNLFNPYEINLNNKVVDVQITNLWIHNEKITPLTHSNILRQDISITNEIELEHDVDKFKIDFVGINHNNSTKNLYAYYLEGFDKSWYYTDKLSLSYTNLDPGKYVLHLKVSSNGVWNEKEKSLSIIIKDPYWNTWWFILIEFVFFGSLWFISIFSRRIHSRNYISGILTIFTLIATFELIATTVDNIVGIRDNPVYAFLLNLTIAIFLMPLENLFKKWIKKAKKAKLHEVQALATKK